MITKIVIIRDTGESTITRDDWKTLPLSDRVGLITKSAVKFYNGVGEMSSRDALADLRN
ncbi:MAG TPA: hypothetical protein VGR20_20445 [Acidimicrobiia bacterium]|nr:hypothetical protein [Acidimicrobiia bacterium]